MLHDELKKNMLYLKQKTLKSSTEKHSGVLILDELKKLKRLNLFFFLEYMMIIVAHRKKYTKSEITKRLP